MLNGYSFFVISWEAPQEVDSNYGEKLRQTYTNELHQLLDSLPSRFHQFIQKCLDSIDAVLALPMVLLHRDFSTCNIMVDEVSCYLTGVIDWAEAEICPFGLNLHSLESLTGTLHLRNGWRRYESYEALQDAFWDTFRDKVGDLDVETMRTIEMARIMRLLLERGFTRRLANMEPAVPIRDDETGRYNMIFLVGSFLTQ
jgi:serine/threonine protein kinase